MRPAASSHSPPYSQPLDSSQIFTYDLPVPEPDLNAQSRDPNYSYSTPEGTGVEVKLPANTNMSNLTPGEKTFLVHDVSNVFQRQIIQVSLFCQIFSPDPPSETCILENNAGVRSGVTLKPVTYFILSEITFNLITAPIVSQ